MIDGGQSANEKVKRVKDKKWVKEKEGKPNQHNTNTGAETMG